MAKRASKTTLERKTRLVFGLFILLTVGACLWWPWWQLERLSGAGDDNRAEAVARAYLQNVHAVRFAANPESAKQLERFGAAPGQAPPRLIALEPAAPGQGQRLPEGLDDFERASLETFLKHPEQARQYETVGDTFRYVQALRCENPCLACHEKHKAGELLGAVALELDLSERHRTLLVNRLVLVGAAVAVAAVSILAFVAIFRYVVVRPVQHLKDVTDRVSEGDLQVRSEIDTGTELEVLSDALNHMLDTLAKVQADLRAATEARDARLDELTKANVALFEANQVKTKFVATMSHELRTPLNSILGFAEILNDAPAVRQDAKLGRYARNILSSARMLREMINDLLDLAQIESGRLQVRCEKVSPPDLAEVVCAMVRPMLADTALKFAYEVDPETPLMTTDATKVQQILYNLLSNAVKFTEQGEVRLKGYPVQGQRVAFAVSDTGPGIARDQQLRIFDRFTQLDSSYTRRYRGTGLGLSIVKELTGLLGGTVAVESEVGKGSTFTVVLPVDSSAAEGRTPASLAGGPPRAAEPAPGHPPGGP